MAREERLRNIMQQRYLLLQEERNLMRPIA